MKDLEGSKTMLVIRGKVLNVEKFFREHPGGPEVLQNLTGSDATQDFDEIGHSVKAKNLMMPLKVGVINEPGVVVKDEDLRETWEMNKEEAKSEGSNWWKVAVPVVLGLAALLVMKNR